MGDQFEMLGLLSREVSEKDLDLIAEWEADPDTRRWLGDTSRSWHERAIADRTQLPLFVTDGVEPVGFTVFARMGEDEIELRRMVVAPERRGLGFGRKLLRSTLMFALEFDNAESLWLDVKRDNMRARGLYESEGFDIVESIGGQRVNADGTSSDLVFMRCTALKR